MSGSVVGSGTTLGSGVTSLSVGEAPIITNGLVINLDAGNTSSYPGSGTTWTDLSGNGNNATLTGPPTYSTTNGGILTLDGFSQYGIITATSSTNSLIGNITFGMWFNASYFDGFYNRQMSKGSNPSQNWFIEYNGSNPGQISTGTLVQSPVTTFNILVNNWYYIVCTYTSSLCTLYSNGVFNASGGTSTGIASSTANIGIGCDPDGTSLFQGSIGAIHIYNRALSAAEVYQNFTAMRGRYNV